MRYTEVRDNQTTEYNLCRECAELKGLAKSLNLALSSLSDMLAGMIRDIINEQGEDKAVQCPNCGLALTDFKKLGRLGCPQCYQTFSANLNPLLRRIHGSNQHLGKRRGDGSPVAQTGPDQIRKLKTMLKEAVAREDYERAAVLRDEIRELEARSADEPAR